MRAAPVIAIASVLGACLVFAMAGAAFFVLRRPPAPPPAWAGSARVHAFLSCPTRDAEADAAILEQRAQALGITGSIRAIDPQHLEVVLEGVRGADVLRSFLQPSRLELTEVLDGAVHVDPLSLPPGVRPGATPTGDMGFHADSSEPLEAFRSGAPAGASFGIACTEWPGAPRDCEAMYLRSPAAMGNAEVESADAVLDAEDGRPCVTLRFTAAGAQRFALLTRSLVRRRLAIVIDGRIESAPVVFEEITGGVARITMGGGVGGEESFAEARALAAALDVGAPLACRWSIDSLR